MELQPHVITLASPIMAVIPTADHLAVRTCDGIELLDRTLRVVGAIAGAARGTAMIQLVDGRFVVFDPSFGVTQIHAGRLGGRLAPILPDGSYAHTVHATSAGFVAPGSKMIWVDVGGDGRWIDTAHAGYGSAGYGDRVITTSYDSMAVISERGDVLAHRALERMAKPVVVGDRVVLRTDDALHVLALPDLAPLESLGGATHVTPFGGEILTLHDDGRIACSGLTPDWPRWDVAIPDPMEPIVIGDRIVVGSWTRPAAWILDRDGAVLAELALPGNPRHAVRFGDGIALSIMSEPEVAWWRPEHELVLLDHEVPDPSVFAIPDGFAAGVGRHLLVWRTDVQGEAIPPAATAIPFGVPLVINGELVTALTAKRWFVAARDRAGRHVAISPDAEWRPALNRAEALAIVERAIASGTPADADLVEIADALGTSARVIHAAVRDRSFPLAPPHALAGYDYLGAFSTTGSVTIADPCYAKRKPSNGPLTIALRATIAAGRWHVFARNGIDHAADRTAELVAIHDGDGFATFATEPLGSIGVDAGCAGIFDKACPAIDLDHLPDEGVQHGKGALAFSGYGDGFYDVLAGRASGGTIVKLRLVFLDNAYADRAVATPANGRAYSVKQRYAIGEAIAHPTFGMGTVTDVRGDGKIAVSFGDGPRVLVHARG